MRNEILDLQADPPLNPPWERGGGPGLWRLRFARQANPAWATPAFLGLLAATALLYLWNLGSSGWANAFYSAAVQAGTQSWKAFFFGSLDASNFITIDKSPASLWVMEISARLFGLNSWSVLAPQALEGVATVAVVYVAVRRWFGPAAGLLAGVVVALTPVAALMFRFNNPDALLVLLLTAATYATLRGVESGRTGWLLLASSLVGTAFLAKMLQAFVIVPVLFGVYLLAGRPRLARRVWQLILAGLALVVSSGWWVAVVELTPAASRPYIGGSQTNSVLELILGYNGFGRLTGNENGSVGGLGTAAGRWGPTGWDRLFNSQFGGQVSWLIPAALILLGAGLWLTRGRPRHDPARAALLAWGGTLIMTGFVFSFALGIIHPYYSVALAPAIGALVGIGGGLLWARRADPFARLALAAAFAVSSVWAFLLLNRSPDWYPALRAVVLVAGLASAALVLVMRPNWRRIALVAAAGGLAAALAGPAAYTLQTVSTIQGGAIPSAGPVLARGFAGGLPGGPQGARFNAGGPPGAPPPGARFNPGAPAVPGGFAGRRVGAGFLEATRPGAAIVALLQAGSNRYLWVAATVDANNAAAYQLSTNQPVMAIGGFNGTDPAPSLAQFQTYVREGKIHYFIAGGRGPGGGNSASNASQITAWVQASFPSKSVDGVTMYDLTTPNVGLT
jgi:4-amino-4-deoxy-L-arabinose transferase-like glycosyltransferase